MMSGGLPAPSKASLSCLRHWLIADGFSLHALQVGKSVYNTKKYTPSTIVVL